MTAWKDRQFAPLLELVDINDLGSLAVRRESSSLSGGTNSQVVIMEAFVYLGEVTGSIPVLTT